MSRNLDRGTTIPDFMLPDENGDLHRLSDLEGDNALVLHLSRGEHCRASGCTTASRCTSASCAPAFTELVTIMPNDQHDVFKLKASTGARWTFLSDADLDVQRHFDINEYADAHNDYAAYPRRSSSLRVW